MSNIENLPVPRPELRAGAAVRPIIPSSMEEAYRIAAAIIASGMAPQGFSTPEKCLVAIMMGAEIGMTPMQSIQRIAVINGRPALWGDAVIGLVRGSGLCEYVKEHIDGEGDQMVATCEAKRKGETAAIVATFSVMDARKANLWGKAGPWQAYPKRMLQMRARAFALRDGFADILGGMYVREELDDTTAAPTIVQSVPIAPPPAPKKIEAPQPPAEPELPAHLDRREPVAQEWKDTIVITDPAIRHELNRMVGIDDPEREADHMMEQQSSGRSEWDDFIDMRTAELACCKTKKEIEGTDEAYRDTITNAVARGDLAQEYADTLERIWERNVGMALEGVKKKK